MYVRELDDQVLTFRVSGKLWMRSLVMSDVETESEWAHLLGRSMAGELKGKELTPLITDMVTWKAWRDEFPETTVLKMKPTAKQFTREFYRDRRRFVFGFAVGSQAYALPMTELFDHPVHAFRLDEMPLVATFDKESTVTHLFEATLDGQELDFEVIEDGMMKDKQTGSRWNTMTGKAVSGPLQGKLLKQRVGIMSFRKAWQNFHPESTDVAY